MQEKKLIHPNGQIVLISEMKWLDENGFGDILE